MAAAFEVPEMAQAVLSELAGMPEAQYERLFSYVEALPKDRILPATLVPAELLCAVTSSVWPVSLKTTRSTKFRVEAPDRRAGRV
jgi:type II secretory pathway component PulK